MAYSSIAKPEDYFNTKLTTGTGSSQAVTGVGFQPDWIWGKRRDSSGNNSLFDSVRGITKGLESNRTGAEFTSTDYYSSFDSDGFTIAAGSSGAGNGSSQTAVQWCWLGANGTASNSDGSITSTVSANTTAGFSIVSYSGSTNSTFTVGHGLGAVPKIFILKKRSSSGTNWVMYNANLGNDKRIQLNNTDASASTTGFGSTDPTSSVFTVANGSTTGADGQTYIAYCFAEKKGYSKFGRYTGNGDANGTFVYTGFKPAWVMVKRTDGANSWIIMDNKRTISNPMGEELKAEDNSAGSVATRWDQLSSGFKLRNTGAAVNGSGAAYIYMAFAENPFVANDSGTAVPVTAR